MNQIDTDTTMDVESFERLKKIESRKKKSFQTPAKNNAKQPSLTTNPLHTPPSTPWWKHLSPIDRPVSLHPPSPTTSSPLKMNNYSSPIKSLSGIMASPLTPSTKFSNMGFAISQNMNNSPNIIRENTIRENNRVFTLNIPPAYPSGSSPPSNEVKKRVVKNLFSITKASASYGDVIEKINFKSNESNFNSNTTSPLLSSSHLNMGSDSHLEITRLTSSISNTNSVSISYPFGVSDSTSKADNHKKHSLSGPNYISKHSKTNTISSAAATLISLKESPSMKHRYETTFGKVSAEPVTAVITPKEIPKPGQKTCHCKKSRCLKLYCECFGRQETCSLSCTCVDCHNTSSSNERSVAIRTVLDRHPTAFDADGSRLKIQSICNCKKSFCLKKYCECFQNNIYCTSKCRCNQCRNLPGTTPITATATTINTTASLPETAYVINGSYKQ